MPEMNANETETAVKKPNGKPAVPPLALEAEDILTGHIALNPKLSALRTALAVNDTIEALAMTIREEGQQQAALVRPNPNKRTSDEMPWELVYGHRRLEACRMLGISLRCDIRELDNDEALRAALLENWQRKEFTVSERARHVAMLRKEYGWEGPRGTKKIAHHLGVAEATVTQMDRMTALPADVLRKVDAGEMTARAALELAPVKAEARPAVSARAQELADQAKSEVEKRRAEISSRRAAINGPWVEAINDGRPSRVEGKHVRQAARETKGALPRPHAPGKPEIKAWWRAHEGDIYPPVLAAFVTAHVKWLQGGKGRTDKWLEAALEDVADALQPTNVSTKVNKPPSAKAKKTVKAKKKARTKGK